MMEQKKALISANPFARKPISRGVRYWIPFLEWIQSYEITWLGKDIIAGLVLTTVLIPVGMGYSEAAGLPAIYGLYATIIPLLAYFFFGPSRILVLGPDSALAGLVAATILPLSAGETARAVLLAGMLAIMTGVFCILAGMAKFGFITDLLSKPIRYGYLNGIAITVLVSQLSKMLGFSAPSGNLLEGINGLIHGIDGGFINWTSCVVGLFCLAIIGFCKRYYPHVPGAFIAVLLAMFVTWQFNLATDWGLKVLGPLPQGLPVLHFPMVLWSDFQALLPGAAAIAFIAFTDMSVLSRTFALRNNYEVDANQELVALGVANIASGLFQGFVVSSSASRTPVAESAGAKTQLSCFVGAVLIALLLVIAPKLFKDLPQAALGAIVISACISLFEFHGVLRLYHLRREEFYLSCACFLAVTLSGVVQGIFIAIFLSLAVFIWRAWRPYNAVLGRVDGLKGYHDITRYERAKQVPGLVLFRWDAPLFFANAEIFHEHVCHAIASAPTRTKWVVVAAEPITDVDTTAADMLFELDDDLKREGIELCFAEMKDPVKDRLKHYGLFLRIGADYFFPTLGQAVDQFVEENKVDWIDWEEIKSRNLMKF